MEKINNGILCNADPISKDKIAIIEKDVVQNNKTYAYVDENYNLCFSMPDSPEGIKNVAWNLASSISSDRYALTKKEYRKKDFNSYDETKCYKKLSSNVLGENEPDDWVEMQSDAIHLQKPSEQYPWDADLFIDVPSDASYVTVTGQCSGYMSGGTVYFVFITPENHIIEPSSHAHVLCMSHDMYVENVDLRALLIPRDYGTVAKCGVCVCYQQGWSSEAIHYPENNWGYSCLLNVKFS